MSCEICDSPLRGKDLNFDTCLMCHRMYQRLKNGKKDLIRISKIIEDNLDGYSVKGLKRPSHRFCSNQICVAGKPNYTKFVNRQNEFGGNLTELDFNNIIKQSCHYCNKKPANGIDRKNHRKGYFKSNCLPCCSLCNYLKGPYSYNKFITHIKKISAK